MTAVSNAFAAHAPREASAPFATVAGSQPAVHTSIPATVAAHDSLANDTAAHPEDRSARYPSSPAMAPSPPKRHMLSLSSAPPVVPNSGRPYSPPQRRGRR